MIKRGLTTANLKRRFQELRRNLERRRSELNAVEAAAQELRPIIHDLANKVRHVQVAAMRHRTLRVEVEHEDGADGK